MPGPGRTICIAGAGIAGLSLALALAKFGVKVMVLERSPAVQEIGAGLQISPNARRALNQLGLDSEIAARSFEPNGIDVFPFGATRPLVTLELGAVVRQRFGAPYTVMHRADLAAVLYEACKRFANIEMIFGVRGIDAVNAAQGVAVSVEEADGATRTIEAFAFVGADGVQSRTRTSMLNGPQAEYSGAVAWRATLPAAALKNVIAPDRTSLLFGPGYHAVCYPLPHRQQFNVALFAPAPMDTPASAPELPRRGPRFDAILSAVAGTWTYWPISIVSAEVWHQGNIGLIGDAAHAMLPFQAQGAAMAIEDAVLLAPLLISAASAESAFARSEALRRPRLERVRRLSEANGRAFHMQAPLTLARDAVIAVQGRRGHLRRLDWLYGYDPAGNPPEH